MSLLKILVVDDEDPARARLKRMLEKHSDIAEVVGEACDGAEALQKYRELKPNVLFLDVQMPAPNGLEVAAELADEENPPWVVFLTAFAEHAVKAFELKALDYLVKPVSSDRLKSTLDRIKDQKKDGDDWAETVSELLQKALPEASAIEKVGLLEEVTENRLIVEVKNIDLFFTREEKCYAQMGGKEYLLQNTMSKLESSLPTDSFFRSHRCYIVNLDKIHQVVPWFNGAYNIRLKDGTEVPLTRRKVPAFKEKVEFL